MKVETYFSTGFYSPYLRALAFLKGQTFGRTPWLRVQSNARPVKTYTVLKS